MFWFHVRYFFLYSCLFYGILLRGQCEVDVTKRQFRNMVDKNEIKENLRRFTGRPHPIGSKGEEIITNYIRDTWKSYGFEVEDPEYEVLLSFPQEDKPNKVSIINNKTRKVEHEIIGQLNINAGRGHDGTVYKYTPYYSVVGNGTVEGELVFAGSGWPYHIELLKDRGISLKGKIVVLSSSFVDFQNILNEGAVGVIPYPDPYSEAVEGTGINDTFPNKPGLPGDAVKTLTLAGQYYGHGDPSTPLLPSSCGVARLHANKIDKYIPLQPISYNDARDLLSRMQGEIAPDSMKGKLKVDYRLGPGLRPTKANPLPVVRLEVNNQYVIKKVRNVIATIPGSEEPDRYVLIGNHKDAVVFGGSNPSSGTAVLMEISRVLWKLRQKGWRPKRTIKLCSWTGEEDGIIGSTEWVQENQELLKKRAVAYLNTDPTVMGRNLLNVQASPLLGDVILKNAKELQDPANSSITLFESMLKTVPKSKDYPGEPHIYDMIHSSDHLPFLHFLGLSVADLNYFLTRNNQKILYPVYHTQYDTFEWVERFADPHFLYSRLMARLLGGILLDLSDSKVLPFNVTRFAISVQNAFKALQNSWHSKRLDEVQMTWLERAIKAFVKMANTFESEKSKLMPQQKNPLILRMFNDQMSGLEKMFLRANALGGLLVDQNARIVKEILQSFEPKDNMLFISEKFNIIDKIAGMNNLTQSEKDEHFEFEMSLIIQAVREATKLLQPASVLN